MKINSKRLVIMAFSTLALSSSSLCFGSKFTPYNMQRVGDDFESVGNRRNSANIDQKLKMKYSPNCEIYIAFSGQTRKVMNFRKNINHLIYLENSFDYVQFLKILCRTGVINLGSYNGEITFNSDNWLCTEAQTESGKGFILLLTGICKENKGKKIEFHFDPVEFAVMPDGAYDIDAGVRKYNSLIYDTSVILDALGVSLKEELKVNSIDRIDVPKNVVKIGEKSFYGHYGLSEINMPNTVRFIGENAFCSCINLKKLKLPNNLKKIGDGAFQNCRYLQEVEIPRGIEEIGECAFEFCTELTKINIPDTVKVLGQGCFISCNSLSEITVPGSVKEINRATFACCQSLEKAVISEGVEYIGQDVFASCSNLEKVSIPSSIKVIDDRAFSDCEKLNEIEYNGKTYHDVKSFMDEFEAKNI